MQIHVHHGNLGWQNNNVWLCINDYKLALSLRTGVLGVGGYDKKVANCHPARSKREGQGQCICQLPCGWTPGRGGGEKGGNEAVLPMTKERKVE